MRTSPTAALLVCLLMAAGCDEVGFRVNDSGAAPDLFQPRTMRALLSESGLRTLYQAEHPQGMWVEHERKQVQSGALEIALGPIAETLPVDRWEVQTRDGLFDVAVEAHHVELTISARIEETVGTRICRFSIELDRLGLTTSARIGELDGRPQVEVSGEPEVAIGPTSVSQLGNCPPADQARGDVDFDRLVSDYVTEAWQASATRAVELSPLDTLGLIHGQVELDRLSNFDNRRGRLRLWGRAAPSDGARVTGGGLELDLDMSLRGERADCAPPIQPQAPSTLSADAVTPESLAHADAHLGIAVAAPLLMRLAETSTRAGFACRGLENTAFDGSGSNLSTEAIRLDQVGLGRLAVGPFSEAVISPENLPELAVDASSGTVELVWTDLGVDLYAEMQDVPVRILELTSSLTVSLRPVEHAQRLELRVDSVSIRDASLQSRWMPEGPMQADLLPWTRRLMLLVFDDALSLPLPILPGAPLELVGSQVRQNDLLMLFRFEEQR